MGKNMKKGWTGERLETFIYNRDAIDHLHRYAIAQQYVTGKTVLDIASGEGYGTNLLSENAAFVYGVDIDETTVAAATRKYHKNNIRFQQGSTSSIPLENQSVDVVVSFETIEHHDQHDEMMREIKRVLKPGGMVIISTPDKLYYSDQRNFKNEFHIKELYQQEFETLLSGYFAKQQLLAQRYCNGNSVLTDIASPEQPVIITGDYKAVQQTDIPALYLVAIASDESFERQGLSVFDGSSIMEIEYQQKMAKIYNSNSYKVGHKILMPFKFLKKAFK
ncbi:MAG: class I SAM-dependent methyltransferase [Flavobacterium sp.]|nr:class I SAM-dependent methyltransferase [Flavobacterium sp.]